MTGRPRRCGWFDACLVRQTRKVAGINGIALTKLDVLDGLPELKICVGYQARRRGRSPICRRRKGRKPASSRSMRR